MQSVLLIYALSTRIAGDIHAPAKQAFFMHISTKAHIPIYAGCMKRRTTKAAYRRKPIQKRAQTTVDAMLDAVIKLLKRVGGTQVTTNQIAEAAGVSIGSLYQYFPDKRALFIALHQRHIEQVDQMIAQRISECVDSSLEQLVQSLMDGMVELHASDPELAELLQSEVPHELGGHLRSRFDSMMSFGTR